MPWSLFVYLAWFGLLIASIVVAILIISKRGAAGVGWASCTILGALLSWAWPSAVIGLYEIDDYASSAGFMISLAIGVVGIAMFGIGCLDLRRRKRLANRDRDG